MVSRLTVTAVDCADPGLLADFWRAVLGWVERERDDVGVAIGPADDPLSGLDFLRVPDSKTVKNRLHCDLRADGVTTQVELHRLLALGARRVDIGQGPDVSWVVLADPEGNEFCLLSRTVEEYLAAGPPASVRSGSPARLRCGTVLRVRETSCDVVRGGRVFPARYASIFPEPRVERVSPGHLVAIGHASDGAEVVAWRWYDAVVLGNEAGQVRLWEPAHGEVLARPRAADHALRVGTRAYLSAGLPGADWWVAGPVTDEPASAVVELAEVERLYTETDNWHALR